MTTNNRQDTIPGNMDEQGAWSVPTKNMLLLAALRATVVLCEGVALGWVTVRHGAEAPMGVLATVMGAQVLAAAFAWHRARRDSARIFHREWFSHLLFDVVALTAILFFTGGSTNPFVSLLLLPLIIVASTLPGRHTWAMGAVAAGCYTFLMIRFVPLPMAHGSTDSGFHFHVMGMWTGFLLAAGSVSFFAGRMADLRRRRDQEVARLREQALTDRYLARLGAQAAGAAHELGTPLATVAVIAKEVSRDHEHDPALVDQMAILRSQVERCKSILSAIAAEGGQPRAESGREMPVNDYLNTLIDNWQDMRPTAQVSRRLLGSSPAPKVWTEVGLSQALLSLLNNAADAGDGQPVEVNARWSPTELVVDVCDRGPGFPTDDPKSAIDPLFSTKADGLGLGLFLTQAVIDQLGGTLHLENRDGGGAISRVKLPLAQHQAAAG